MPSLYHHPLCPHSRYIRLIMGELGMEAESHRGAGAGSGGANS
jgi:glutathione S-transferase